MHVELDSKGVVQMLKKHTKELSVSGPLVEEIKSLLRSFVDWGLLVEEWVTNYVRFGWGLLRTSFFLFCRMRFRTS